MTCRICNRIIVFVEIPVFWLPHFTAWRAECACTKSRPFLMRSETVPVIVEQDGRLFAEALRLEDLPSADVVSEAELVLEVGR